MVWGCENRGYGAARNGRMMKSPGFESTLPLIIEAARHASAGEAYAALFTRVPGPGRVKRLGPSFGTKVLHAAGHSGRPDDLMVYDLNVWRGLSSLPEGRPSWAAHPTRLTTGGDTRYCAWCAAWDGSGIALTRAAPPCDSVEIKSWLRTGGVPSQSVSV